MTLRHSRAPHDVVVLELQRGQAGDILIADLLVLGAQPGDLGVDVLRRPEHDGVQHQSQ